jgi:serine/threonine protein kinase
LEVALGDFGISSILAKNISIKETRMANTPLYAAPEAFADFASTAGDFWSLGTVLLECLEGYHPLDGLSINMVMREICSRGIKVPSNIPSDLEKLLMGLLTRDDKKRWRHKELISCLNGDLNIPVYYEEMSSIPPAKPLKSGPYRIGDREFKTI